MARAVISGTRRAIKELADGTVRLQVDIDPECRRDFFRLFPEIDTRIALAPLKPDAKEVAEPEVKGGQLAKAAGMMCSDPAFQRWIVREHAFEAEAIASDLSGTDAAAEVVRLVCGVKSRAELDHNAEAATRFHERVRKPWLEAR